MPQFLPVATKLGPGRLDSASQKPLPLGGAVGEIANLNRGRVTPTGDR